MVWGLGFRVYGSGFRVIGLISCALRTRPAQSQRLPDGNPCSRDYGVRAFPCFALHSCHIPPQYRVVRVRETHGRYSTGLVLMTLDPHQSLNRLILKPTPKDGSTIDDTRIYWMLSTGSVARASWAPFKTKP